MKNIIFQISGGIGKCIAATAVCEAIKKKYVDDNLIVVSGYPEVFINNPFVKKSLNFSNISYFYSDFIQNKDVEIFIADPYLTTDAVLSKKHLIEIWCDLYKIPYNGEMPRLFFTSRELEAYQNGIISDKPIFIMQTNGGADNQKKYSWARDLPKNVVYSVIEEFKNSYNIIHVRRENQLSYPNTNQLTAPFRAIAAISMLSKKRLVIDSFLQHTLAALNLPAVSCWIVNSPVVFGYNMHNHILANPYTNERDIINAFIYKYNINGEDIEFPYFSEEEIFNVDAIIKALKETGEKPDIKFNIPNISTINKINLNN